MGDEGGMGRGRVEEEEGEVVYLASSRQDSTLSCGRMDGVR